MPFNRLASHNPALASCSPAFHYTTRGPWICRARVAESRSPSSRHAGNLFQRPEPAVRTLLSIRFFIGGLFGWDRETTGSFSESFARRLTDEDRTRSLVPAGTPDGLFRIVYRFENEQLDEVANRTVHAGALSALVEAAAGYRFYFAVYVREVGPFTPLYMAAIDPFRKLIVYPALLRGVSAQWSATFGADMTT
jgi:hypothetical protein